jgi:hypothetical protein
VNEQLKGQLDASVPLYERVLLIEPNHTTALVNLGAAHQVALPK